MSDKTLEKVGVVTIGRNEGERLKRCLRSVVGQASAVCYVDSGSTDGSAAFARSLGVHVIELDMAQPFTMARGRNAGYRWLRDHHPQLAYTQFVDGDCEVVEGWLAAGADKLDQEERLAAVSGRRRERNPQESPYNQLADLEWDTPVGEVQSCHGDVMVRNRAVDAVGLFDESMICGEEPELALRLRQAGWRLWRLEREMTRHDAAMTRFSQWWKRSIRGGWAYAEAAARYGQTPERFGLRARNSILLYGIALPALILIAAPFTYGLSMIALLAYPLLAWRVYRYARRQRGWPPRASRLYALFCTLAKFPQALGLVRYHWTRLRRREATLIEYKSADPAPSLDAGLSDSATDGPAVNR